MAEKRYFTEEERKEFVCGYKNLLYTVSGVLSDSECREIRRLVTHAVETGHYQRNRQGINPALHDLNTALLLCDKIGTERGMILAILLNNLVADDCATLEQIEQKFDNDCTKIIKGLNKARKLSAKQAAVESENFKKLLLTFAEDIRVIIIMIVERLCIMRAINHHPNENYRYEIACEASYLFAPLAHRLGLYNIKSELEDLSLKYTNREVYSQIAHKLSETKRDRDKYIAEFIAPIEEKLHKCGLKFEIKGRTKSIYSIWNKMKKQKIDIDRIYDLFAIRIIIDTPIEKEIDDCWLAYSQITDDPNYKPIPERMKDWLTVPKENGYESLHITVLTVDNRRVEIQIRTRRMDEIAERGLAAHWKYKGIKSENDLDSWMNNVRSILEAASKGGPLGLMKDFKMDLYDKEVFVFTPKGDLYKLPAGATVLDFAFLIHSRIGASCTGAKVNGKLETIKYVLKNGDTIEVLTSQNQTPKRDWLNIATTIKCRVKIRQALNEIENKAAELGKEMLQRRFKNRKMEMDDAVMMRLIRKLGFKTVTDFYNDLANERLDTNQVLDQYNELAHPENETEVRAAEEYTLTPDNISEDELVIGSDLKGINYRLSKCCNPIFGDDIFGFVSTEGTIKIHKKDCPNAKHIRSRYQYRIINARWAGKMGSKYVAVLHIVGNDNIGIVTNISSIISKEKDVYMRSISIESRDGLFQGHISVAISDLSSLNTLIKKLKTVKGVKDIQRSMV